MYENADSNGFGLELINPRIFVDTTPTTPFNYIKFKSIITTNTMTTEEAILLAVGVIVLIIAIALIIWAWRREEKFEEGSLKKVRDHAH